MLKRRVGAAAVFALLTMIALVVGVTAADQAPAPAAAQGRGRGAAPPPPPEPQPGHPSGKLVLWGDLVNFERPGTPNRCIGQTRYKRGARVGFRMTAIDGGTGEVENTAVMTVHINYAGKTIDVPARWRGNVPYPAHEYPRNPAEMWTALWIVPVDAPVGMLSYTVTATDRFGRTASFSPFPNLESQLAIVE